MALQMVQRQQCAGELTALGRHLGRQGVPGTGQRRPRSRAGPLEPGRQPVGRLDGCRCLQSHRGAQMPADRQHRLAEALLFAPLPLVQQTAMTGLQRRRQQRTQRAIEDGLMNPAAGERIQGHHPVDHRHRREAVGPFADLGRLARAVPRLAGLVQQHDDRLVEPGQHREFRRQIARIARTLGRVEQVEHDVGPVARRHHRLLAQVEGPIRPAIPDLGQEPADRIARRAQAPVQADRIAQARGIAQQQPIALVGADQFMDLGFAGHMGFVADLADIAPEQGARQRRLAGIGVRDQAELDARGDGQRHGPGSCESTRSMRTPRPWAKRRQRSSLSASRVPDSAAPIRCR